MADYTIRVVAETKDADDKVNKLDRHLESIERSRKIHIEMPDLDAAVRNVQALGSALKTTYKIASAIPLVSGRINDIKDLASITTTSAQNVAKTLKAVASASPSKILTTSFTATTGAVNELAKRTSNLGYTIFGVTQSVNVLRAAFGGMFTETIGREIKLQEALLRTKTTLASTADVAVNGKRITDPFKAIVALGKPIDETIESIRMRSLEIAGTTSDAIIQVFGTVASQIGNVGGSLKDAEDLAITFSAALGTLGLSDPYYATQEIRSILTGTIDNNSILARSLGLTNEEVNKAKNSAEGLVGFLERRLAAFTAGQSLAAKGFAGITSNIQEFSEEIKRAFGRGMLAPLLEGLTVLYERLQVIFKASFGIADAVGSAFGAVGRGFVGAAAAAPSLGGLNQRGMRNATERGEDVAVKGALAVQEAVDKLRPQIAAVTDEIVKAAAMAGQALATLAKGFAIFKFEQFKVYLSALTGIGGVLNSTVVPAITEVIKLYGQLLALPAVQWASQLAATFDVLNKVGVLPLVKTVYVLTQIIPSVIQTFRALGNAVKWVATMLAGLVDLIVVGFSMAVSTVATGISKLGQALVVGVQVGVTLLLNGLKAIIVQVGIFAVELAALIQDTAPAFGQLAVKLAEVGRALLRVQTAFDKATLSVAEFGLKAANTLDRVQIKADEVKLKVAAVGDSFKNTLGGAVDKVKGGIGSMIMGFIKFTATLIALELAITAAVTVFSALQRRQQEISDQTRAEIAVKRLSTVFADVSENATAATKAMREYEQQIVDTRVDSLTKKIGEMTDKIKELQEVSSSDNKFKQFFDSAFAWLNPANSLSKEVLLNYGELFNKAAKSGASQDGMVLQAILKTRIDDINKAKEELTRLTTFQDNQAANTKAREDVQILRKERAVLEKEIKDLRKQYAKEIKDFEWEQRRELLTLEQQFKEETARREAAALARKQQLENQSLGSIARRLKEALDEYDKGLFAIQNESQRKQFELQMRKGEIEKQVADYRYTLEQQTLKLREKMGDLNRKIVDYESEQRKRTAREVLAYAFKEAAAREGVSNADMTPDEKRDWLNESARRGVSAERLLSIQSTSTDPKYRSGSVQDQIAAIVEDPSLKQLLGASPAEFSRIIGMRAAVLTGQLGGGAYIQQRSEAMLGTGRFKTTAPPSPPKLEGIDFGTDDLVQRRGAALDRTFQAQRILFEEQLRNGLTENFEAFRAVVTNPATWGIPTSSGELDEKLNEQQTILDKLNAVLTTGAETYQGTASLFDQLRQSAQAFAGVMAKRLYPTSPGVIPQATAALQGGFNNIFNGASGEEAFNAIGGKERLKPAQLKEIQLVFTSLSNIARLVQTELAPKTLLADVQTSLANARTYAIELANQAEALKLRNYLEAEGYGPERVAAELRILQTQKELKVITDALTPELSRQNALIAEKQKLLANPKLTEAERAKLQKELDDTRAYVAELLRQIDELKRQLGKNNKTDRDQADVADDPVASMLKRWNKEVQDTRALVASLGQTIQSELGSAMSNAVNGVINGTMTVQEAFSQMFANIGKAFIDMATQMIAKALILKVLGILFPGAAPGGGAGGLGSLFGAGAPEAVAGGGIFSGAGPFQFRAAGGPISAGRPYIVGERGPELVFPGSNGYVMPADRTAAALAQSRAALGGGGASAGAGSAFSENRDALSTATSMSRERQVERWLTSGAGSTEIKYSRVGSGDLPFVTEQDMLQATRIAAQEGAKLGQQRTLAALRNNPATRRSIGV